MIHQGQRLALGLEAGDHLPRVHAGLDDLERDLAAHGLDLLGHVHDTHAPLADLLQQLVRADDGAGSFDQSVPGDVARRCVRGRLQEAFGPFMGQEQGLDAPPPTRWSPPQARAR